MLSGIFSTLLLPETKQKTLEDISHEKQEGFVEGSLHFVVAHDMIADGVSCF